MRQTYVIHVSIDVPDDMDPNDFNQDLCADAMHGGLHNYPDVEVTFDSLGDRAHEGRT